MGRRGNDYIDANGDKGSPKANTERRQTKSLKMMNIEAAKEASKKHGGSSSPGRKNRTRRASEGEHARQVHVGADGKYTHVDVAGNTHTLTAKAYAYRTSLRKGSGGPIAVAASCKVHGPGLENSIAGGKATFTIEAADAEGNRIETGGEPFRVDLRGSSFVRCRVVDNENGTYSASYVPSVSGTYDIAVTLHGVSLPGSPFGISVLMPRPDASKCVLRGDALLKATAREQAAFGTRAATAPREFSSALRPLTRAGGSAAAMLAAARSGRAARAHDAAARHLPGAFFSFALRTSRVCSRVSRARRRVLRRRPRHGDDCGGARRVRRAARGG